MSRNRVELVAALLVFVGLTYLLIQLKIVHVDQEFGDMAQLSEAVENLATRGWAANQIMPNLLAAIDSGIFTMHAEQLATAPLTSPAVSEDNHLQFHAYWILYPLAGLAKIFPTSVVLLVVYVLSFTATILIAYFALRRRGVSPLACCLFVLLLVSYPGWSEGLRGQFYPDRVFILAGFVLMLVASETARHRLALVAAAVFCASIDERAAVTAGLFLLGYAVLYWRKRGADLIFKAALGVVLVGYSVVMLKFFLPLNIYDSGFLPSNLSILIARFSTPAFAADTGLFLLGNAPLLLLALYEWRAALIAFLLMLPNIIGNIGGAEKIGWSTHYGDEYLPALFWAALMGFVGLYQRFKSLPTRLALEATLGAMFFYYALLYPYTGSFAWANVDNTFVSWFPREVQAFAGSTGVQASQWSRDLPAAIPEHTDVSTVEQGMPWLYRGRTLRLFPMGIDQADYAVLVRNSGTGTTGTYSGVVNYLGPEETIKANAVIVQRMIRDGYDFDHPVFVGSNALVVLKRDTKRTNG